MKTCHCGNHVFTPSSYWHVVLMSPDDVGLVRGALSITSYPSRKPKCATAYWPNGKVYRKLHMMVMPPMPGRVADHKNRNPLDNRRENLRYATIGESARNRSLRPGYTGFRGVQISRRPGTFDAFIMKDRKRHYLGRFDTANEAAKAYNDAAVRLHGEFAVLNQIDDVVGAAGIEPATAGV